MVVEMGMNNSGEISLLTDIARPTIGVITNIGTAHIGNLGSRENIMKAKLEITEGLSGPLIINQDNDIISANIDYIKSLNDIITIGIDSDSDYKASCISSDMTKFKINGNDIECKIGNRAFIYNSLVSYAIGILCGIDIKKGILNFELTGNRLEKKLIKNDILIIDDTYNASLDSIKSSLEILRNEKGDRKIAVIGDVLELGSYTREIHRSIGKELLNSNLDYIVLVGDNTKYTLDYLEENNYSNVKHFDKESDTYTFLDNLLNSNDTVLVKGSNGMKLKNIVNYLTK